MFKPTYIAKSAKNIDYKKLKEMGINTLFFDLDNTFTKPFNKKINDEEIELVNRLKSEFNVYVVSNGKEKRVKNYCNDIEGLKYLYESAKPTTKKFKKFVKDNDISIDNCVFVGDQLFTDIWFANRLNMKSILVDRITKDEEWWIKAKRILEKPFMLSIRKRGNINAN